MRDTSRRGWQAWRIKPANPSAETLPNDRFARTRLSASHDTPAAVEVVPHAGHAEKPGPDGIRHALVARIRAEIEAGTYDTEERWALAEERLLAHCTNR